MLGVARKSRRCTGLCAALGCAVLLAATADAWGQARTDAAGWAKRLNAAYAKGDWDDAVLSLTMLARADPRFISSFADSRPTLQIIRQASGPERAAARFELLEALFEAGWRQPYIGEPSEAWRDLALLWLERGGALQAHAVARRITAPNVLIGMRADRRFDAIVEADPARFDVEAAVTAEIAALRAAVERAPDTLEPVYYLAMALERANRCEEALEVVDAVRARAASDTAETKPYTDIGLLFGWILDYRASALWCLGRWEESERQLRQASVLTESGETNTSQAINLAGTYLRLGRPADALATLKGVGEQSPYGAMQVRSMLLGAAAQLKDADSMEAALDYLRAHQDDSIATFQGALVVVNDLDEAARILIHRLETPELRLNALEGLQDYAEQLPAPVKFEWSGRSAALVKRRDVQAAIDRVGRIQSYPFVRW